ncbi:MAG: hypothetical protein DCC58_04720 [Chloroflexi bacterium]|nr:MAG: hypothetical protein DCC58_04720 [Chloroflexota bacterium]
MQDRRVQSSGGSAPSNLPIALTIVSGITAALVLVQAMLAGRFLYINPDLVDLHEIVANVIFLTALAQVVLAYLAMSRKLATRADLVVAAVLMVLVTAQIGLGYSGREPGEAAALHVANGVLVFGVAIVALMLSRAVRVPRVT